MDDRRAVLLVDVPEVGAEQAAVVGAERLAEGQRARRVARVGLQPAEERLKRRARGCRGLGLVDPQFLGDRSQWNLREQLVDVGHGFPPVDAAPAAACSP
ncbi:MAG: hypothetical protein BWY91_02500 [bacterium ADurb.BinA028]|nr:MAG: hypothetical protein BWY91_02500 [bacterium ADurb.BinA028]